MTLLLISFIAGILTAAAPCVLPLLPVIVGGSLSSTRSKKPFVIASSLALSVIIFTLILKSSTALIGISASTLSYISGGIIIVIGISLLFPKFFDGIYLKVNLLFGRKANTFLAEGTKKENIWGDIIIGAALGPVFSSCSPTYFVIVATVLPASFIAGLIYLITYSFGLSLTLLIIALWGNKAVEKFELLSNPDSYFKKIIGIIFVIVGVFIFFGADKKVQLYVAENGYFDPAKIEQKLLETLGDRGVVISGDKNSYQKYIEIQNPSGYVNSDPFLLKDLIGKKIILLDIMTYSCINCQRTFPYLNAWYEKYKNNGLEIVAIHTPEFAFEKNIDNVRKAMQQYGIKFPVVLDNNYSTWNAYKNNVWPRKYLIDIDGNIRLDHSGEGEYKETEEKIRELLSERAERLKSTAVLDGLASDKLYEQSVSARSRETYFGAFRNEFFGNGVSFLKGEVNLSFEENKNIQFPGRFYLSGIWNIDSEFIEPKTIGELFFSYQASKVFLVAEGKGEVEVYKNGNLLKKVFVDGASLYSLVEEKTYSEGKLKLVVPKGVMLYTFTFG